MGRIIASVVIENVLAPEKRILCDALVDTGCSLMVLPMAWKERLGQLQGARTVDFESATQQKAQGQVCGPVRLQIEAFPSVFTEVLFVDMEPEKGNYEPLIGYIPLEQSQAAVDMLGHRLVYVRHLDLK
jgi:hypothetical protein